MLGGASCNGDDRGVELCMGRLCGVVRLERGMFCLSWVSCRVLLDAPSDARVRFVMVSSGHEGLRLKHARGEGFLFSKQTPHPLPHEYPSIDIQQVLFPSWQPSRILNFSREVSSN